MTAASESTTGLCWLDYSEQMALRQLLKTDELQARITELEVDNEFLRAEIGALQRMRHAEKTKS